MNRNALKTYAPQARRDFIQAITDRATFLGLSKGHTEPVEVKGDFAIIAGRSFPKSIVSQRKRMEEAINREGFDVFVERIAYTWFNRFVAIRYMELHGYLDHGYRVLSQVDGKTSPEILEHAEHIELPNLKSDEVIELKLSTGREAELYRMVLIAQCNALYKAMPFLFEWVSDETELLLPDNLLHSDSLIRKLVNAIPEEDWQQVEIIGWLYQFYISEKKDEVIGKVVASEDIPAATQLFTPNWIVKYLVQNTLGRQWLATYPQSTLRQQMEYYTEPAEQKPDLQEEFGKITPTSLNPEELTLLDPACGSGHILVEAYDLFKAIYLERGYRAKDIPRLILQKNLYGLEIDDRAAQLASFALLMKARADDRSLFLSDNTNGGSKSEGLVSIQPKIIALQESNGLDAEFIFESLSMPTETERKQVQLPAPSGQLFEVDDNLFTRVAQLKAVSESRQDLKFTQSDIVSLVELFRNAKSFGSLIQVPSTLASKLPLIEQRVSNVLKHGDLTHSPVRVIAPLLEQSRYLATQYDTVVANPPYMDKGMNGDVKEFVGRQFADGKANLFSAFMIQGFALTRKNGFTGMVTMQSWMFLRSYIELRKSLLKEKVILTMAHLGPRAFPSITGEVVQTTAFACQNSIVSGNVPRFFRLVEGDDEFKDQALKDRRYEFSIVAQGEFLTLPDCPIAYWVSSDVRNSFATHPSFASIGKPRMGMATGNNAQHVRFWHEVSFQAIGFGCKSRTEAKTTGCKWFPYNKGGEYRRWYGNHDCVVNWHNDGELLQTLKHTSGRIWAHNFNLDYIFKPCVSWSDLGSKKLSFRYFPDGFLFDAAGLSAFFRSRTELLGALGLLNSKYVQFLSELLNPTMHFQPGDCGRIPFSQAMTSIEVCENVESAIAIAKEDWGSTETSWEFTGFPLLTNRIAIHDAFADWKQLCDGSHQRMSKIENMNENFVRKNYGIADGDDPAIKPEDISLYRPEREEDIKRLLSYAIGCMMGRYSLDRPGLIYAQSGGQNFDYSQYPTFRADDDGIIPLLESDWGIEDDASNRIVEFIRVAYPLEQFEENLKFTADSLGPTNSEQPRETIRRYLATSSYKHHLSMYKKRPIYWLFSSGKQRAFQCLVYLHRYNEGTLARMRTEYVIPILGKINSRIDQLNDDISKSTSTSNRKKLEKESDKLLKQRAELQTFDEKLRHYADLRITLDLDDGVKVNYGKFGDLLAEVKAITGGKDEE